MDEDDGSEDVAGDIGLEADPIPKRRRRRPPESQPEEGKLTCFLS